MAQFLQNLSRIPKVFQFKDEGLALFQPLKPYINYLPRSQRKRIVQAFLFARDAHHGQIRMDGSPYITHPVGVTGILADLKLDPDTLIAALLHDVIEDTNISKKEISTRFGEQVGELVDGVSKLERIESQTSSEAQSATLQKMILATASDLRILLVKLADRTHNAQSLDVFNPKKRQRIGQETLEIYAPLAARIGINSWRLLLEDCGFKAIYPWRHKSINKAIKIAKGERRKKIDEVSEFVKKRLKGVGINSDVFGREKNAYSVFRKMNEKKLKFDQILDLFAYRVIVKTVDDCYRALGIIHGLYNPVPGKIKDYIALPKPNGYQSLHTILFGPSGAHIEVQIRTETMHKNAEYGIAAHWSYKQSEDQQPNIKNQKLSFEWISNLIEVSNSAGTSSEFIEAVKTDLFPHEVYVFTPEGSILSLPRGATAVDFAYAIHTDVGNECLGCEIDRERSDISTPLQNGQTVYIIRSKFARPNPDWLDFVITAKARSQIRNFLKNQTNEDTIPIGKQLLEQSLETWNIKLDEVTPNVLNELLADLKIDNDIELYQQIGLGNRPTQLVAKQIQNLIDPTIKSPSSTAAPIIIQGTEGMAVAFGHCCNPIHGDRIIGHLSTGKGIVVHRLNCHNVRKFHKTPEKCVPVDWHEIHNQALPVRVNIESENQAGVLANITHILDKMNVNIDEAHVIKGAEVAKIEMLILVSARKELASVLRKLRKIPTVIKANRA